jgi:hypothetical protein
MWRVPSWAKARPDLGAHRSVPHGRVEPNHRVQVFNVSSALNFVGATLEYVLDMVGFLQPRKNKQAMPPALFRCYIIGSDVLTSPF